MSWPPSGRFFCALRFLPDTPSWYYLRLFVHSRPGVPQFYDRISLFAPLLTFSLSFWDGALCTWPAADNYPAGRGTVARLRQARSAGALHHDLGQCRQTINPCQKQQTASRFLLIVTRMPQLLHNRVSAGRNSRAFRLSEAESTRVTGLSIKRQNRCFQKPKFFSIRLRSGWYSVAR